MGKEGKLARQQAEQSAKPTDPTQGWHDANLPPNIPRQTPEAAAAADEQPDSTELRQARGLMATPKLAVIGGHTGIVFLTNYDEASKSYSGEFHRNVSMNAGDKLPAVSSHQGLRPYSADSRSEFCFVECHEDTSVIRNLQRHLQARGGPADAGEVVTEGQGNQ